MKSLFTVRKRKHTKHPQVIVGANKTRFDSMTITHSTGKAKNRNKKLIKNPNPNDRRDAYVSKRVISDFKFNFSKAFKNYHLDERDVAELIRFLKEKIKK